MSQAPNNQNKKTDRKDGKEDKSPLQNYMYYSSMGFELLAIILVCVFGGIYLDRWLKPSFPAFTVFLSLFGIIGGMLQIILKITRKK